MEKLFCHKKPDGDYELRRIPLGKDDSKDTCEIVNEEPSLRPIARAGTSRLGAVKGHRVGASQRFIETI